MNDTTSVPVKQSTQVVDRSSPSPLGWLRGEIDRLFDDFPFARPARSAFNFPAAFDPLRPVADLVDEGTTYRLSVELPGLKQEDIDIEYRDGTLSITGEKKEESENKEGGCLVSERRYGSFRRQMTLPADVDAEGIKAEYKDGVLTLNLKKDEAAAAKPRKIAIG